MLDQYVARPTAKEYIEKKEGIIRIEKK